VKALYTDGGIVRVGGHSTAGAEFLILSITIVQFDDFAMTGKNTGRSQRENVGEITPATQTERKEKSR
jgi:hypothetical protein